MSKILMGRVDGKNIYATLDSIAATNSLVTGMTRSGKSYKLRTMAEALCRQVPVVIIDPEDEFYTLREKYPFLLFGEGGEAPMSVSLARPLARKLLAWKQSAVLSLASLTEEDQHQFVFEFMDELMNQPRRFWTRMVVIADEAHLWAPNSGHGKTIALAAARNVARRGLKRGIIPVWATQRLASLAVAVSSSAENLLVGRTTRSADQDQAAKLLGVSKSEKPALASKLRRCKKGDFFAVGPAYGEDIVTLQTLPAKTTHFSGKIGQEPKVRRTPRRLRYLLPQIAAMVETVKQELVEKEDDKAKIVRLEAALKAGGIIERGITQEDADRLNTTIEVMTGERDANLAKLNVAVTGMSEIMQLSAQIQNRATAVVSDTAIDGSAEILAANGAAQPGALGTQMSKGQEQMMRALRDIETVGIEEVGVYWLAILAGRSPSSSACMVDLASLSKKGWIHYPKSKHVSLTDKGKLFVPKAAKKITHDKIMDRALQALGPARYSVVEYLTSQRGLYVSRTHLAQKLSLSPTGDKLAKLLTGLKSYGIVHYGPDSTVKVDDFMIMRKMAGNA